MLCYVMLCYVMLCYVILFMLRGITYLQGRDRQSVPSRLHTVSAEPNMGLQLLNHEIMT